MYYGSNFITRLRHDGRDAAQSLDLQHGKKIPTHWAGGNTLVKRLMAGFAKLVLLLGMGCFGTLAQADMAYVTNYFDGTVSVIDTSNNKVVATIPLETGSRLHGIAVNSDGTRVYVVVDWVALPNWEVKKGNVSVIDTSNNKVVAIIPTGFYEIDGIAVNPAGTRVYMTASNKVTVIDTSTNSVVAVVPIIIPQTMNQAQAYGVVVNPAGTLVYVANYIGGDTISVIDANNNSVVKTIAVGYNPKSVAINPSGTLVYVTHPGNKVSVIDTRTHKCSVRHSSRKI